MSSTQKLLGVGALFCLFVAMDVWVGLAASHYPLGMDYLPVWTAMRVDPSRVYDFAYITHQQAWLHVEKLRPFAYPPSALVILSPMGLLPYWPSYFALVLGSLALYLFAAVRLGADWRVLLLPIVLLAGIAGQVTYLVGGLVMLAVSLRARPLLAGVLYGVAGALKPQTLVLLPLALIAERNWRTFFSTGITASLIMAVSWLTGPDWIDWLHALPRFREVIAANPDLMADAAAPYVAWGPVVAVAAACVGVGLAWFAFRTSHPPLRVLGLMGGGLLVSPYAMNYALALVAPAVMALRSPLRWPVVFLAGACVVHNTAPMAVVAVAALALHAIVSHRLQGPESDGVSEAPAADG